MPVRYTIQHMQQFAKDYNGKCLSKEYVNDDGKLKWMCNKGHTWDASYTIIRQGGWCMQCAKNETTNEKLEVLQKIAKQNGGKCLSHEYVNNHTKLKWICKHKHKWEATSRSIKEDESWCPICEGRAPRTILDMQKKAKEKGGKCISTKYKNSQSKLWWECALKHKWQAHANSIYMGRWCRKCSLIEQSIRQRNDISIYQKHAKKLGGKLISTEYFRASKPMEWQCAKKHIWKAAGGQIVSGSWCPKCAGKAPHKIEDLQKFAKKKGGKCLSENYVNIHSRLIWQCAKKHTWKAATSNVIHNGSWCPVCAQEIIKFNLYQYRHLKKK